MNTHTPGPWKAWDDDGTGTMPCVLSEKVTAYGNFYVAQCHVFADAQAISVTPEALQVVRDLVDMADDLTRHPELDDIIADAREVLKKLEK